MSKKSLKNKQKRQKWLEYVFYGIVIALVILLIVRAFLPGPTAIDGTNYVITEEGHVHTTDGAHIGTYEEVFGTASDLTPADDSADPAAEPAT